MSAHHSSSRLYKHLYDGLRQELISRILQCNGNRVKCLTRLKTEAYFIKICLRSERAVPTSTVTSTCVLKMWSARLDGDGVCLSCRRSEPAQRQINFMSVGSWTAHMGWQNMCKSGSADHFGEDKNRTKKSYKVFIFHILALDMMGENLPPLRSIAA